MKKFLAIMVLSLVLSGCGGNGMKHIDSQVQLWNNYKNHTVTYKAYFEIFEWQGRYSYENFWRGSYDSLDAALAWSHQSEWCKKGCKVLYIGNEKISLERRKEIAEEYLPPGMVEKYFVKPIKKEKKKKEKQEEEKKKEEDQLAKEKREKEEEKIEKKKADDEEWF